MPGKKAPTEKQVKKAITDELRNQKKTDVADVNAPVQLKAPQFGPRVTITVGNLKISGRMFGLQTDAQTLKVISPPKPKKPKK